MDRVFEVWIRNYSSGVPDSTPDPVDFNSIENAIDALLEEEGADGLVFVKEMTHDA